MIKNLNFSYGNVQVFKDANFYLNKGEKIILVGENGTGKSTLVNILCGLLKPKSGQIIVDHKEVDLNNINWQNKIGYVPQNMYMFDLPLFNNICLGKDVLSKEDIKRCEEVIEKVNLSKYMKNINESTKIDIGEDGSKLSGGQIQRIGIARALFRNPEMLILDEATSSIDENTENDILDEIFEINDDLTIVLITHKIKNLSFSKKVYELKNFSINKYHDE
jgi:ATP-binding cassette subfamily C protein